MHNLNQDSPSPFETPNSSSAENRKSFSWLDSIRNKSFLGLIICCSPLLNYCYALMFWLLASASEGKWLRQGGGPDPINFFDGIPLGLHRLLTILSMSLAPVLLFVFFRRKTLVIYVLFYSACLAIAIALFRLDIWGMPNWLAD